MLTKAGYSNIVREVWSSEFYKELRPALGIAALVQNEYEGEIKQWGDTVKVQTISTPGRAQILTSDNEAYDAQIPTITNQDLVVNKRSVYPVDITDWARYMCNPRYQEEIRQIIVHEIARSLDQTILDNVSPGASASGVTALLKSHFAQAARVQDSLNVPSAGRVAIVDPYYKEDLLAVNEMLSRDYNASSSVFMDGVIKDPVYGYKVYVSNLLPQNTAYFWHPSFFQIAIQQGADYKEIDLEGSTNVPSYRVRGMNLFGVKQFDANRCYKIYNT